MRIGLDKKVIMEQLNLLDFINKHTHRQSLDSEVMAAAKASYGANSVKSKILQLLKSRGSTGLTPDEFNDQTGGLINTSRRRFTDLWKEGHIKHHPDELTRPNNKDNECVVWVLGKDANTKTRFELLNEEIIRLKNILFLHGLDY